MDAPNQPRTGAESYSPQRPAEWPAHSRAHVLRLVKGMKRTMTGLQDDLRAVPEPDALTRLELVRARLAEAQQALAELTDLSSESKVASVKCDGDDRGPRRTAPHSGIIAIPLDD